eukprot:TRINITY_DN2108_c0_g1_i1.p1 TRINITY_DN2108_c0_g1~~TRINITY_DN2108_c0_g1_i1.p1  ORF type:complete len:324 (+),score=66.20 TRINITY_DN2108_c0_g1_i1:47-1018(+)
MNTIQLSKKMINEQSSKPKPITDRRKRKEMTSAEVISDVKQEKVLEEVVSISSTSTSLVPKEIMKHFKKGDPKFYEAMQTIERPCAMFEESSPPTIDGAFQSLCRAIIYQQLAGSVAGAIYIRFLGLFPPGPFPSTAGVSTRKAEYLRGTAEYFQSSIPENFISMNNDDIARHLTSIRGIGQWTVDIFLMFYMKRLDVLPVGDLAIRKAMASHFDVTPAKGKLLSGDEMVDLARPWEPYRSVACWYLWQLTDQEAALQKAEKLKQKEKAKKKKTAKKVIVHKCFHSKKKKKKKKTKTEKRTATKNADNKRETDNYKKNTETTL